MVYCRQPFYAALLQEAAYNRFCLAPEFACKQTPTIKLMAYYAESRLLKESAVTKTSFPTEEDNARSGQRSESLSPCRSRLGSF